MRLLSLAATAVLKNSPFRGTWIQTTEWNSRRSDLKCGNSSFTFQAFEHSKDNQETKTDTPLLHSFKIPGKFGSLTQLWVVGFIFLFHKRMR